MYLRKSNGACPDLGRPVEDELSLAGHSETQCNDDTAQSSGGQSNFVSQGVTFYRKRDFASNMRRDTMRGRDWDADFTDIAPETNRRRIESLQAREAGTLKPRDPFALFLGVLDE